MKLKLFLITGIAGLLTLSSCSKFLEEKSQSEVIPKTAIDFRELLIGSGYMDNSEPMNFLYFMDDDVDFFLEYDNDPSNVVGTYEAQLNYLWYTWQPKLADRNGVGELIAEDPSATAYAQYYTRIMGCNAVLENIDKSIGTQQEKDRVKGEALAVRAMYYFRLANLYGEPYNHNPQSLCVPLKLTSGIVATPLEQATVADVYELVVHDLQEASSLMDPLPIMRKDYHINQPAIHILLSRVFLYMEKWKESVAEANKVFEQGGKLVDMTSLDEHSGTWLTYNNPEVEWLFGGNTQPNQSTYVPAVKFLSTFDRKDARFSVGFSLQNTGVSLASKLPTGLDLAQTLRSSEALLNRAEASVQLDDLGTALKDLNDLRRKRIEGYVDEVISDKAALLQAVRDERRKEFCYECFRWFDLRRYGMPEISHRYQHDLGESVLQYKLKEGDPMYVLPFPTSVILRNAGLKQSVSGQMPDRVGQ
ncbi:RagB/SusD family nutrient uptake outer membrane protein [Chitinophaga sp. S165]|uniref:RagB/SusD family nutrient uptake outer membrane protein n=1 Tax=Chitinophaga sp. S165 TaxID=2135462 RepID=UPI000D71CB6B|nr:RagB/SusD family nutrient uptake outer membrane protein [Chitinophaga sp. S165]PWV56406.1 SusD-like starch-binding protein associating with outer membrane [Chitinophaga sp. S165]